jgi:hypothetical protein
MSYGCSWQAEACVLDGRIQTIRSVQNPDKLGHVGLVGDAWAVLREANQARHPTERPGQSTALQTSTKALADKRQGRELMRQAPCATELLR